MIIFSKSNAILLPLLQDQELFFFFLPPKTDAQSYQVGAISIQNLCIFPISYFVTNFMTENKTHLRQKEI